LGAVWFVKTCRCMAVLHIVNMHKIALAVSANLLAALSTLENQMWTMILEYGEECKTIGFVQLGP